MGSLGHGKAFVPEGLVQPADSLGKSCAVI